MAEQLDIEIQQGDTFEWEITVQDAAGAPLDLTTYTIRGQGRKKYSDTDPAFSFVCTKAVDQVANKGLVVLTLSDTISAAIAAGKYLYDIEVVSAGGAVKKIYKGTAIVPAEVTK